MKIKLTLLVVLLAGTGFAQINQVDSQGRKQGKWEKTHPESAVYQYRGEFKDDKPVGKFTYYYESSKVKASKFRIVKRILTLAKMLSRYFFDCVEY